MKTKNIILTFAVAMFTLATFAQTQLLTNTTSAHNFKDGPAFTFAGDNLCAPCHTPHNALTATVPLWNRSANSTVYVAKQGDITADSQSRLCLSCHDGSGKLDAYGGSAGTTLVTTSGSMGTTLTNDHPINVTYAGGTGYVAAGSLTDVVLVSSKVECASCHSMHSSKTATNLLRTATGTNLCVKCHVK